MEAKRYKKTIVGVLLTLAIVGLAGCAASETTGPKKDEFTHPTVAEGQACSSCKEANHDHEHEEPFTDENCAGCHTIESWTDVTYSHKVEYLNTGLHSQLSCLWCHTEGEPAPSPACETCHADKSPHKEAENPACVTCHTPDQPWVLPRPLPEDHLSLEGGHKDVSCFACHNKPREADAEPRKCVDCHGENHGGLRNCESCHHPSRGWEPSPDFDHNAFFRLTGAHKTVSCAGCHRNGKFAGTSSDCVSCHGVKHGVRNCASCHTPATGWRALPGFNHGLFGFRLTGAHTKVSCNRCHPNRRFAGTPSNCSGCHRVAHAGLTRCQNCHTTSRWRPSTFNHSAHFRLTGNHQSLSCARCHPGGRYRGTPTSCTGCHGTAHGGLTACAQCHTPAGWKPTTFNHANVFPLTGAHAGKACTACHPNGNFGTTIGGGGKACASCHASVNPHGTGIGDCGACHTPAGWTSIKPITHPGNIRLGTTHTEMGCRVCHNSLNFSDATTPCQTCHSSAVPHVGPTDCGRCHQPSVWSDTSKFTHRTISEHANEMESMCLSCHPGGNFTQISMVGPGCLCHPQ